jgi:choline-sulfatase
MLGLLLIGQATGAATPAGKGDGAPGKSDGAPAEDSSAQAAAIRPPASVLLVTIDTLRADRLVRNGALSSAFMPNLAELARRGTLFRRALCQTPLTVPSHVTILTGLDPRHHGVRDNNGYALGPTTPTLATQLSTRGMRCAAFIGGAPLSHRPDLVRGFETYDDRMTRAAGGGMGPLSERRAGEVVDSALSWLRRLDPKTRFFAWVHFYDPHDPYEAPVGASRPGDSAYDGEVRYADAALGRLVKELDGAGRLAQTLIVVTGDHGEMLGAHGEETHGIFLYQEALAVPLVIVLPGGARGRTTERPTILSDLVPTMLDLLGAPAAGQTDGESAAGEVRPGPRVAGDIPNRSATGSTASRVFYVETIHPRRRYGWSPLYGLVEWPMKFIEAPGPELYDLGADPGEAKNLLKPGKAEPWRAKLAHLRDVITPARSETVDEERLAALRSLGYAGGAAGASAPDALEDRPRRDPKRGVGILSGLKAGLARLDAGDGTGAARAFEEVLGAEPDSVLALHNRGIAAMMVEDLEGAAKWFGKAAQSDPQSDNVQNDLGVALARLGRSREAEAAYRRALGINPDYAAARFSLGVLMMETGRPAEARRELLRIRATNPDFPHLSEVLDQLDRGGDGSASQGKTPPGNPR